MIWVLQHSMDVLDYDIVFESQQFTYFVCDPRLDDLVIHLAHQHLLLKLRGELAAGCKLLEKSLFLVSIASILVGTHTPVACIPHGVCEKPFCTSGGQRRVVALYADAGRSTNQAEDS